MSSASESAKPKARLIIPFWGPAYLEKLVTTTIPALLAPGNLPALLESFDVEVVLLTQRELQPLLDEAPAFHNLSRLCPVDVRPLDDFMTGIPGDYGVVLSYALYRGFTDLGPRMLDTYLLFLNADFIIADGSYRSLARRMLAGQRVIHAPSFRATLEDVIPALHQLVDPAATTLAVPPRRMVELALKHKHLTVRARTVNQRLYHQWRMDQFYWFVDDDTLIGYQVPVALVAIRPERVLTEPTLVWDYAFVPDAAPTLPRHFISDSDEFFMLEPQSRLSGKELMRLGSIDFDDIAKDLSNWTTREQRECGRELLVFHARDIPNRAESAIAESRAYMAEIYRRLSPEPRPHVNHPLFQSWFAGARARIHAGGRDSGEAPPTRSLGLEYAGPERVTAPLAASTTRMGQNDGVELFKCVFVPEHERSVLRVRVAAGVRADPKPTAATGAANVVMAAFRNGCDAPLAIAARPILPGGSADFDLTFDAPSDGRAPVAITVRLGWDQADALMIAAVGGAPRPTMTVIDLGPISVANRLPDPPSAAGAAKRALSAIYHAVFGTLPELRVCHPLWLDTHFVAARLKALIGRTDVRRILVASRDSFFKGWFAERVEPTRVKDIGPAPPEGLYDLCLCDLSIEDARGFRSLYRTIRPAMKDDGVVIAYVFSEDFHGFQVNETMLFENMLPDTDISEIRFFGGPAAALSRKLFHQVTRQLPIPRVLHVTLIGATMVAMAPFVWFANRHARARDPGKPVRPWTSLAIELRVRRAPV